MKIYFSFLIFLAFLGSNLWTNDRDNSRKNLGNINNYLFKSSVNKNSIFIADPIEFTLTLELPKGFAAEEQLNGLPLLQDHIGPFTILESRALEETIAENSNKGSVIFKNVYLLTVYDTGTFTLPALTISFPNLGGKPLETSSIDIKVTPLVQDLEKEQKAFKANRQNSLKLFELGTSPLYLYYFLASLFLVGAALTLIFLYKKKIEKSYSFLLKKEMKKFTKKYPLPLNRSNVKKYYYQFSYLVKFFLSQRFDDKKILGLTSKETIIFLNQKAFQGMDFYENFFTYADRIKFSFSGFKPEKDKYFQTKFKSMLKANFKAENKAEKKTK